MFALGIVSWLYSREIESTIERLQNYFGKLKNKPEIANLNENAVYSWVDKPANARCIGVTWAFKTKSTPIGYVSQLKSRVCALGYLQTQGIDCLQSYAPVSTMVTWRCMVAEASRKSWVVDVVDIKSAFLQSELEPGCVVYVRPPKGVTPPKPGQV